MHPRGPFLLALAAVLNGVAAQHPTFAPVPPILVPSKGDKWNVGELRTVEWGLAANDPLTNSSGDPILGFILLSYDSGDPLNPVLLEGQRLASGFPLSQKMVNIIVPEVPTRQDYSIFLNADADGVSWTDPFEILNPNDPQGTGARPTSLSVSTAPPISVTVVLPTPTDSSASSATAPPSSASTTAPPSSSSTTTSTSTSAAASQTATRTNGASSPWRNDILAGVGIVSGPFILLVHAVI
ncbi:hypothetical protein C8T65DRAFT_641256 [Cerioporus squamosus]|nr:hypothetical protein C8T65DRAFT_641256 [Cerioporus squamosus]